MSKAVHIIVSDRIYIRLLKTDTRLYLDLTRPFEHFNVSRVIKEKIGLWVGNEPRTLATWECADDPNDPEYEILTLPRGGMARVRGVFAQHGRDYEIEDQREFGDAVKMPKHLVTLYAHQEAALEALLERENAILRAPTGSGKTTIIFAAIARCGVPALVIVPNKVLFNQWVERAQEELGIAKKDIGQVRGGKMKLAPVTIAIQKTVANKARSSKMLDYFGMVIADEVDLFAASTFFASIDPFPARYRFGVSADHRRKDKKEYLILDLFGDVVKHIKHEELVKSGHVLDVEVRVVMTEFRADWYGRDKENEDDDESFVDDDDPPERTTEKEGYDIIRLVTEMANSGIRNRIALRAIRSLLAEGEQVIVIAHLRDHCRTLDQTLSGMGTKSGLLIGDQPAEFETNKKKLKEGSLQCGVGTYKAVMRGLDLPRLGAAVCVTPCAANEQSFQQVRGRVCRTSTGKSGACILYLWDKHIFPGHLANLARWNANTVIQNEEEEWIPAKQWMKQHRAA